MTGIKDMSGPELVEELNKYAWGSGYRTKDGKFYGSYHGHGYETTREELEAALTARRRDNGGS